MNNSMNLWEFGGARGRQASRMNRKVCPCGLSHGAPSTRKQDPEGSERSAAHLGFRFRQTEPVSSALLGNGSHPPAGTGSSLCSASIRWGAARAGVASAVLLGLLLTGCSAQDSAGGTAPLGGPAAGDTVAPLGEPAPSAEPAPPGESAAEAGPHTDAADTKPVPGATEDTARKVGNGTADATPDGTPTAGNDVGAGSAAGTGAGAAVPSAVPTEDPKPTPDRADAASPRAVGGVGFDPGKPGPPEVNRPGPKPAKRVPGKPADFGGAVAYTDGVALATSGFGRGTVQNEGPGFFTGMPYVVIDMALRNDSATELDLSLVVATLRSGNKELVAQPLYGEVATSDFGGALAPGQEAHASYAFLLLDTAQPATLYVDIDAQHEPATVKGKIP